MKKTSGKQDVGKDRSPKGSAVDAPPALDPKKGQGGSSLQAVLTLDPQGVILEGSQGACDLLNLQPSQVVGKGFARFVHPRDKHSFQQWLDTSFAGSPAMVALRLRDMDGRYHQVNFTGCLLGAPGKKSTLVCLLSQPGHDAPAGKGSRKTEENYRDLVEKIPVALYTDAVDDCSTTVYMGPQIANMIGYTPQEWIDDPHFWLKIMHPEDRPLAEKENIRTNQTGDPFRMEYRLIARDGHVVWIRDESSLVHDQEGKPLCWQGILLDISDRKKAEAAWQEAEKDIRAREDQYRQMVELSPEAIAIHSQGVLVYANPAAIKLIGAKVGSEVVGKPVMNFVHPDSQALVKQRILEALRENRALPAAPEKFVKLDGSIIDVEVATMPFSYLGQQALQVLIRDVTQKKQANALQEAIYQIALATESTRSLNDLFPRIHQIISSVMPAENFYITLYDEARNVMYFPYFKDAQDEPYMGELQPGKGLTAYVLRTGRSLLCTQAVHDELERQGAVILLGVPSAIWLGVPLIIEGKTIGAMVVQHYTDPDAYGEQEQHMLEFVSSQVAIAITRKQAEEDLSNSEASYRGLFNSVEEAIYIQDQDGRFLDVNEGAVRMYGYRREDFLGKSPADISAPGRNDIEAVRNMVALAFEGKPQQFEFWGRRRNGEVFPKDVRLSKGVYFGKDVIIAMAQDITGRKKVEEALQRQLKELTILQAVALAGTEAVLIDDLLERVTKIISYTFTLDSFGVLLFDPAVGVLRTHSSYLGRRRKDSPRVFALGQGITGTVAATGTSLRVADVRKDPRFILVTPGIRSEVCVPIKAGSELLGVINAESRHLDHFSPADERLFITIAGTLATAIQKLRLFEAEHTRRQEAETLRQAVAAVTSSLSFSNVLEAILASLAQVIPFDSASVVLERSGTGELEIVTGRGLPGELGIIGKRVRKNEKWQWLAESKKTLVIPDIHQEENLELWVGGESIRSWMAVPLVVRGNVIGFLSLESRTPASFSAETAVLAENFAYTAALAVENARLYGSELQRRQEAETLRQAAAAVSTSLELEQVLTSILLSLKQVLPYDSASIMLLEDDHVSLAAVQGFEDPEKVIGLVFPANDMLLSLTHEKKQPFILEDACSDPRFQKWAGTDYVRGWMAAPLVVRDKVIGYITINNRQPGVYDQESAALVQAFAYQAATAIDNAHLFESEQRRRQEAEILREAVSVVASTLDLDQSIRLILEQLERVVPYDSASVQILKNGFLEIMGGRGWPEPEQVIGLQFPVPGENPNSLVVLERKAMILAKTTGTWPIMEQERHQRIKSWMGIPLIAKNEVIGLLSLDSLHEGNFTEESARLAGLFASQVAAALVNSRLYQEALQAAERRGILHRASQEIAQSSMDPEQIYEAVHRAAGQLMPAEAFVIALFDETDKEIVAAYLYEKSGRWPPTRTPAGVGLSGKVIASGKAIIIQDLAANPLPDAIHFGGEYEEVRSLLAVPMRSGEKVIGMLSAQSYQPYTYQEDDQLLLEMLSAHAAVAIENSRLYNQTRQRLTELEMVNRISTVLREAQTIPEMLPRLLDETLGTLHSDSGAIWLHDPARRVLKESIARGWFAHLNESPIPPGEGIAGTVFLSNKPYVTRNFSTDPVTRSSARKFIPEGWGGVCVPIRTIQETIGVLFVSVKLPRAITDEEVHFLTTISEIAGNAIRRADLYQQTQRQVQRLASLRAIDMAINTILDLRVTLGILIDHIHTQLKVDAVDVLLLNPRTQILYHAASSGFRTDAVNYWQVHIGDDIAGKSVRSRTTTFIQNIRENTQSKRFLGLSTERFVSYFCVPLIAKGQVKGVLEIYHRSALEPDADWNNFLETLAGQAAIAIDNSVLFEDLQRSNVDLALAYDATIEGWSKALDLRDRETEGHTRRVTEKTIQLAQLMGVSDPDQVHIRRGALLHDIGKMGVPDNILNKSSELSEEEWQIMRRHPVFAYEMLYPISYLRPAVDIPYCHHERWNGAGYPRGLRGEEIPLAARLFAVVDVWDALTSDRPYRKAWSREDTASYIRANSGIMFDPAITNVFLNMIKGEEL